ncbi:mycorrhiza-induced NACHT/WD-repeat protein, partial [Reticulomyxa filosa]
MFATFRSSSKLIKTCTVSNLYVKTIDYTTLDGSLLICSGSLDNTVRVWDIENDTQIQPFNGHSHFVNCAKFSPYHYHNNRRNVTCSSSFDKTIRFWDIKDNKQLQVFNGHTGTVSDFSPLQSNSNNENNKSNNIGVIGGSGYTICSGSYDRTIHIWDIETTKKYIVLRGHGNWIMSVKYGLNELGNTILSGSMDKS